jgi:hypothetical protein
MLHGATSAEASPGSVLRFCGRPDMPAQTPCCREALLRSAAGPEAFLAMRANFKASLAAVSASSYVAGVGDRHLQVKYKRKKTSVVRRGCTHELQFKIDPTQQLKCDARAQVQIDLHHVCMQNFLLHERSATIVPIDFG